MPRRLPRLFLLAALLVVAFGFVATRPAPVAARTAAALATDVRLPYTGNIFFTSGPHAGANSSCDTADVTKASGIDFALDGSSFEVLSVANGTYRGSGTTTKVGPQAGKWVAIEHDNGQYVSYWHLDSHSTAVTTLEARLTRLKQDLKAKKLTEDEAKQQLRVPRGLLLGMAGKSGNQDNVHLHMDLRTHALPQGTLAVTDPYFGSKASWDGQQLDGWTINMLRRTGNTGGVYDYQGTATRGATKQVEVSGKCGVTKVLAIVSDRFPDTKALNYGECTGNPVVCTAKNRDGADPSRNRVDGNTAFAFWDNPNQKTVLTSTNAKVESLPTGGSSQPQPPSSGPVKTVLVLDTSGSMSRPSGAGGTKLDAAQRGARSVVGFIRQEHEQHQTPQEVGLVLFNGAAYDAIPLTSQFSDIEHRLDSLTADGSTNIYAALLKAEELLGAGQRGQLGRSIILMTDGIQEPHRDDGDFVAAGGPVPRALDAGITICTIGFGRQGDFNQELLDRIARDTGCEKMLAAGDEFELQARFANLRHRTAGGTIIAELEGDVGQDETVQAGAFTVSADGQRLMITLEWPGSTLDLRLIDPRGTLVGSSYRGASIVTTTTTANIIIDSPPKGQWKVEVYGREVSRPREPYYVVASNRPLPRNTVTPPVGEGGSSALPVALGLGTALLAFGMVAFAWQRARGGGGGGGAVAGTPGITLVASGGLPITLKPGVHILGREEDCDVRILDDTVSRHHARLTVADGRLYVEDLGSTGGTFINGRPAPRGVASAGDRLRAGNTEFQVLG